MHTDETRIVDYTDGTLPPEEREAFEAQLRQDPHLEADLGSYLNVIQRVRELPPEEPPDRFVWMVHQRLRRRTRGRWLADPYAAFRLELAVCGVLVLLLASLYATTMVAPSASGPPVLGVDRVHLAPAHKLLLTRWGRIEAVGTRQTGSDLEVHLIIPGSREAAFREALSAHPDLRVVAGSVFRRGQQVWLRVQAPPGPMGAGTLLEPQSTRR